MPKPSLTKNSPESRSELWSQILSSSETMNQVAQRNDWELLQELVLERKKLLQLFFAEPVLADRNIALDQIIKDIQNILDYDQQTKSSSQKHKASVLNSLKRINKGKDAVKMYG